MKKVLSLILSVWMLVSLLAMPVYADADDGFNDGQFGDWGDGSDPVEPPIDPEEPIEGTKDNPYQVPKPISLPEEVPVPAGGSVYYQFPALKFANWTLIATGATSVEVDDVVNDTLDPASRGIKTVLSSLGNLVGFFNDTDEDVIVTLTLEQPIGTSTDPYQLEEGANEITIPDGYTEFFAEHMPAVKGEYTLAVSDYTNFTVYLDMDRNDDADEHVLMTEDMTLELDSGIPMAFIVVPDPDKGVYDLTITVTAPAKGSEANPYGIYSVEDMQAGSSGEGDGLWPMSEAGVYYTMGDMGASALAVESETAMTLIINGEVYAVSGSVKIPLSLSADQWAYSMRAVGADGGFIKMSLVYPLGHEQNPQIMNKGKNTLPMAGEYVTYFAAYTAEKDGVLVMTPSTVLGLDRIDANNTTEKEDGTYDFDFIYAGWLDDDGVLQGASDDNVLTIPVKAGDVVNVSASVLEYELDDEYYLPESVELYVCYEADHNVSDATCTKAAKCASCGLTVSKALGHKYTTVTKKATTSANGYTVKRCSVCGNETGKKTIYKASKVTLSKTAYTYNGKVQKPTVSVKDSQGNKIASSNYTVKYASGLKNAGTYKVTVTFKGQYSGTKTLTYKINPINVSKCKITLSKTSYTYNGKVQKPTVTVKNGSGTKLSTASYTVTYASGCKNAGTYKVTVKMKGNYTGTKTLTYKINPVNVSKCKISLSATSYTYNGKVKKPTVTVKNAAGTKLTAGTHYTVTYASGRKNVGTYKVTIKMKGNYTGTKTLTFKINPVKTTVSKLTAAKKGFKVTIAKKTTQVTGYEVQYSTTKAFKTVKTKTLTSYKKNTLSLTGLTAKKTYYVRVRTYKTVNGVKYYSGWSAVKTVKTK